MISRLVISCIKSSPIFQGNLIQNRIYNYTRTTPERRQTNPFHYKIVQLANNQDFFDFFSQNKKEFDVHAFSVAAKTLGKIIFQNKSFPRFTLEQNGHLKQFLQKLKAANFQNLSPSEFMHFLQLSRTMKNRQLKFRQIREYDSFLKAQALKLIPSMLSETTQLYKLAYFYNQMSSLNIRQSEQIAQRIVQILLKEKNQNESNQLTIPLIVQILAGMKERPNLGPSQKKLLSLIVDKVNQQYLQKLAYHDLVRIAGFLNQITKDYGQKFSGYNVFVIFKKVLTNIDQLDEKSIMFILSGEQTFNATYREIYQVIFRKIFDQLDSDGRSSFSQIFTMKIFMAISSKIHLQQTSLPNQQKFLAFLRQVLVKSPRFIVSHIKNMILNDFFNRKHLQELVKILENIQGQFNIPLDVLYEISLKDINLHKTFVIRQENISELKGNYLLMFGQILRVQLKFNQQNQLMTRCLQKLNVMVQRLVETPQKFAQFIFKTRDKSLLIAFNKVFGKVISQKQYFKLFLQNKDQNKYFRRAYIHFIVFGFYGQSTKKRNFKLIRSLNIQDIATIMKISDDLINGNYYAIANLLHIFQEKIDIIVQNPAALLNLSRFLYIHSSDILEGKSSQLCRTSFYGIMKKLITSANSSQNILKNSKTILKVLNSDRFFFNNSLLYINFVELLLGQLQHMQNQQLRKTFSQLIHQGIRLNLITKEIAAKLPKQRLEWLQKKDQKFISVISSPKQVNPFKGQQFDLRNLSMYLSYPHPDHIQVMKKQMNKILNYIQNSDKTYEIVDCLTHFRLGINKNQGKSIFQKLMQNFTAKVKNHENFNLFGILQTIKKNPYLGYSKSFQQYMKKVLVYLQNPSLISRLSPEQHIQIINCANNFGVVNLQYMKKVFNYYKEGGIGTLKELISVFAAIGYVFNSEELEFIQKGDFCSQSNRFNTSLKIFMLLESVIPDPKAILRNIVEKSKLPLQSNYKIQMIYYTYLLAKYPQQTQGWQPKIMQRGLGKKHNQESGFYFNQITRFKANFQKICGENLVQKQVLNNTYYKIRNCCIVFANNSRNIEETKLNQKLIKQFSDDKDSIFVTTNIAANFWSITRFIDRKNPEFFTAEQKQAIFNPKGKSKQSGIHQQQELEEGQEVLP